MTPSTTATHVSVLGLGLLGSAIARRLADRGHQVTGWTRSGRTLDGVPSAPDAATAVSAAEVVLLAVYDAAAVDAVLDDCLADLPSDATVVDVVTVSPVEAARLRDRVRAAGRGYLHCPVLGSGPAVATGRLVLLAGSADVAAPVSDVLSDLGVVVACHDAETAAALKLLANGALADSVISLGEALGRSARIGLDRTLTLDVLEHTSVGGLASGKRSALEGAEAPATFTAGALRKDAGLLAAVDPDGPDPASALGTLPVPDDADISALALAVSAATPASDTTPVAPEIQLDAAAGVPRDPDLLAPLVSYARGHATGETQHFDQAFRPTAHVEGLTAGAFKSMDLPTYYRLFDGSSADDESQRRRTVTELRASGTVATATMLLDHGADRFVDKFVLLRDDGRWRIANKVYHRVPDAPGR